MGAGLKGPDLREDLEDRAVLVQAELAARGSFVVQCRVDEEAPLCHPESQRAQEWAVVQMQRLHLPRQRQVFKIELRNTRQILGLGSTRGRRRRRRRHRLRGPAEALREADVGLLLESVWSRGRERHG